MYADGDGEVDGDDDDGNDDDDNYDDDDDDDDDDMVNPLSKLMRG